ncbi:putative tRNA pseudouridine synthase 1 [Cricetulus griseus]|uniref:tRNA pseudouridine(55) synthase n=1 Tax=Cricetulus griseus TaxID=10029 RepID=G3I9P9_CRIGR|nr:putative tRNA pseudouridine synthase 1 [Cricetulus griseus]
MHKPKVPTSAELLSLLKEKLQAEAGMCSPEWIKRQRQTLKIGHGGTMDSAAQGVLVVGIEKGTKMLTSMLSRSKRYIAFGELGKATDTLDSTGKYPTLLCSEEGWTEAVNAHKRGEAVEARPARLVTVYSVSFLRFQPPRFTLDVECGGGFYIRSLVNDIGKELSSCAHVLELTRTKQGPFTLEEHALPEDRWTIDDIAQSLEQCASLLPDELAFKKPKSEKSSDQALSYEYITLSETKREEDEIKTLRGRPGWCVCPDPGMATSLQNVLVLLNDECDWIKTNQLSEFDLSLIFFV